jgi:hypothetical protein
MLILFSSSCFKTLIKSQKKEGFKLTIYFGKKIKENVTVDLSLASSVVVKESAFAIIGIIFTLFWIDFIHSISIGFKLLKSKN